MKNNKKMNIYMFSLLMGAIFISTFLLIHRVFGNFLLDNIMNYKYTTSIIFEALIALMIFVVMILWKNSYVFTQKHETLLKSLKYGCFYLTISSFFFLLGIGSGVLEDYNNVLNLVIFTLLIGVYEEFLCRGWLLNEFLERYGNDKKGVWTSIIISGVIFGLLHIINIGNSGTVATAVTQVLSAAATGIVYGVIYYKTKNIWSVIILHAFWDFSIFQLQLVNTTSASTTNTTVTIATVVMSILLALSELIVIIPYIKNIYDDVKFSKKLTYSMIAVFSFMFCFFVEAAFMPETKSYEYGNIQMDEYSITSENYKNFFINYEKEVIVENNTEEQLEEQSTENTEENTDEYEIKTTYENISYKFYYNSKKELVLENTNTKDSVTFEKDLLTDYIILEEENRYVLAYIDYDTKSSDAFIKYAFIPKEELGNSKEDLNKIKNNIKEFLLKDPGKFIIVNNRKDNRSYIGVTIEDAGNYVLEDVDKLSKLN